MSHFIILVQTLQYDRNKITCVKYTRIELKHCVSFQKDMLKSICICDLVLIALVLLACKMAWSNKLVQIFTSTAS